MTSNQIAYAGVLVEEQKAAEMKRHDEVMEGIQTQLAENESNKTAIDKWYKEEQVRLSDHAQYLEEQYKYAADLALRKDIENRMASNEYERLHIEREYKEKMAEATEMANVLRASEVAEKIRSDKANESLGSWRLSIDDKVANLKKYEIDSTVNLGMKRLDYDYFRTQTDRELKLMDYNVHMGSIAQEQRRINLANEQFEWQKNVWNKEFPLQQSKNANIWTNSILPFLLPRADSVLQTAGKVLTD